jgi:peptidyl-prolyl cis-trans isomerase C
MEETMKRTIFSILICVFFLAGTFAFVKAADPSQVVAKVNDEEILQSDVDNIITTFVLPQFQAQNPGQEIPAEQKLQLEKNIISQLVTEKLLLQFAAKANITADETLINERLEQVKTQRPDIPEEQLKALLSKDFIIQKTIEQEVTSKVMVSDEEVQKYYEEQKEQFKEPEQVQASHILILVAQDATQEDKDVARKKIEEVLVLAKEGKDFAELAKEYSEGPSKDKGGDLGFFPKGAMVKPFEEAAFAMNEGDISDIVETQFGYHIIKLTGKKAERNVPFEEVKDRLKQGMLQQKTNSEAMAWIEGLKSEATIEMMNQ